jgi:hypothetical protein
LEEGRSKAGGRYGERNWKYPFEVDSGVAFMLDNTQRSIKLNQWRVEQLMWTERGPNGDRTYNWLRRKFLVVLLCT